MKKSPRKRRPTELNLELADKMLAGLSTGLSVDEVCRDNKKSRAVFYKWIAQGEKEKDTVFYYLAREYKLIREAGRPKIAIPAFDKNRYLRSPKWIRKTE